MGKKNKARKEQRRAKGTGVELWGQERRERRFVQVADPTLGGDAADGGGGREYRGGRGGRGAFAFFFTLTFKLKLLIL